MDDHQLEEIHKIIAERDALLHENRILHQQIVGIEQLLSDLLLQHDQERQSLSHDLYHTIGQTMYSLFIGLKMVMTYDFDPPIKDHLLNLEKVTDETLTKIRDMSFALHPFMIEDLGLVDTMNAFVGKLQEYSPLLQFEVKGTPAVLSLSQEHAIYRIFQEFLLSIRTQPSVTAVDAVLLYIDDKIELSFTCTYKGDLSSEQLREELQLIRHRVRLVSGDVQIQEPSPASSITVIRIRIPRSG